MRVLVTGATNPHGEAIVRALAAKGHQVRAFGVDAGDHRYDGVPDVKAFPGWVEVGGSIEPVLAERQVLVHAACMDEQPKGKDGKTRLADRIDRGSLYARYAAEREQVDLLIHLTPADAGRVWSDVQQTAIKHIEATLGDITVQVIQAGAPEAAAEAVAAAIDSAPELGAITGGHKNAVTA